MIRFEVLLHDKVCVSSAETKPVETSSPGQTGLVLGPVGVAFGDLKSRALQFNIRVGAVVAVLLRDSAMLQRFANLDDRCHAGRPTGVTDQRLNAAKQTGAAIRWRHGL